MTKFESAKHWAIDHLNLLGSFVFFCFLFWIALFKPKRKDRITDLVKELDTVALATDARAQVRRDQVELGKERAVEKIKEQYNEELEVLDDKQKEKARELEKDPQALVEHIIRSTM